jgi:hypothetical protein
MSISTLSHPRVARSGLLCSALLWHGEQSTVVTSVGSFTITNIDSRDESDAEPFSFWAVIRNGL